MPHKRPYNARMMASGVKKVAEIRAKVFPFGTSPQLGVQPPAPKPAAGAEAEPVEMMEGHCLGCPREEGGKLKKHIFQVQGQQEMKNGTIRKYGKCPNGHQISHFVGAGGASGTS